ncbi:MAG: response regulator [Gemmatimonadales bacterium]|nr:response regulator [Gemmatimonadales bacterium]
MSVVLARVLVADADPLFVRTVARLLASHDYHAVPVTSGDLLPDHLAAEGADLLVLDPALPGGDAWRALAPLQEAGTLPTVLVLSASAPTPEVAQRFQLGPLQWLPKPVAVRPLLERVRAVLREARRADRAAADARQQAEVVDIFRSVARQGTSEEILRVLVHRLARALRIARCSILQVQEDGAHAVVIAASDDPGLARLVVMLDDYPEIRRAHERGEAVLVADVATDPLYDVARRRWAERGLAVEVRSAACFPHAVQGRPFGLVFLRTTSEAALEEADLAFVRGVLRAIETPLAHALAREAATP